MDIIGTFVFEFLSNKDIVNIITSEFFTGSIIYTEIGFPSYKDYFDYKDLYVFKNIVLFTISNKDENLYFKDSVEIIKLFNFKINNNIQTKATTIHFNECDIYSIPPVSTLIIDNSRIYCEIPKCNTINIQNSFFKGDSINISSSYYCRLWNIKNKLDIKKIDIIVSGNPIYLFVCNGTLFNIPISVKYLSLKRVTLNATIPDGLESLSVENVVNNIKIPKNVKVANITNCQCIYPTYLEELSLTDTDISTNIDCSNFRAYNSDIHSIIKCKYAHIVNSICNGNIISDDIYIDTKFPFHVDSINVTFEKYKGSFTYSDRVNKVRFLH